MSEEKQTTEEELEMIDDTLSTDDQDVLRAVLEDAHSRGIMPVSVYDQDQLAPEDFE